LADLLAPAWLRIASAVQPAQIITASAVDPEVRQAVNPAQTIVPGPAAVEVTPEVSARPKSAQPHLILAVAAEQDVDAEGPVEEVVAATAAQFVIVWAAA